MFSGGPLSIGGALNKGLVGPLLLLLLVAALALACVPASDADAQAQWQVRLPLEAHRTGEFRHPRLLESSGVIASRRYPGVFWTFNDSGNPPEIFATDSTGRDLGVYRVTGAANYDWEAITLGPCGKTECLYIADTGDNDEIRSSVRLYRVPEPAVRAGGQGVTDRAEVLEVRYPDGPHDVEAAVVAPDGAVLLVSKGRSRGVQAFRIPATKWGRKLVTAEALGRIPVPPGRGARGLVTDAALSPDGTEIAVRTYVEIFFFRLAQGDTLHPLGTACDVTGLELQGEGLTWLPDDSFLLTSEGLFGVPGTLTLVRCAQE
ncbi:MAG TPA: hypothetical protein VFJ92_07875 [Gemmatimonadales bacterium]|nr:hypothetical protein [Gemmatimonadales bacterium]